MKSWMVVAFDAFVFAGLVLLLALRVLSPEVGVPMLSMLLGAGAMRRMGGSSTEPPKLPPSATLAIPLGIGALLLDLVSRRHS